MVTNRRPRVVDDDEVDEGALLGESTLAKLRDTSESKKVRSQKTDYVDKTLVEWFGDLLTMSDAELDREGKDFLKILTTWVVRNFSNRRKNGVPVGYLDKFIYPDNQKIDFTRAVMVFIVRILRKRGLRETDQSRKSATFDLLVKAYELTPRRE